MATKRFTMRVLATLTLWAGFGLTASAQLPGLTLDKAFEARPRQPNVTITNLAPDQVAKCRVEPIPNTKVPGQNMGYVVRDAQNRPVRQFVSYDGKSFNIVAFYVDGQEAYREVYPPTANEPYQFRWLGPNGGKWGLDKDRDGKVDEWVVISPEEVSQELFHAVQSRDAKRLDALLPTKESLDALGLPAAEVKRIQEKTAGAAKRLTDAAAALNLSAEAKWIHLELGIPQTTPADAFGGKDDQVIHRHGTVLIEDKGKTHLLQIGELVLVGRSWKVVDGPNAGPGTGGTNPMGPGVVPDAIAELVKQLDALDTHQAMNPQPTPPQLTEYYTKRAAILEQIVQKLAPEQQGEWVRFLIDSLSSAAEGGKAESPAHQRLKQLKEAMSKTPGSPLGAYAAFRLVVAENGIDNTSLPPNPTGKDLQAVQERWRTALDGFIKTYPTAEDAGEAVMRLAMAFEFMGKEGEAKAKEWYSVLPKNYATHPHAAKAAGAVKRLDSEGKPLELAGTNLSNGQPFAVNPASGKPMVVFYWASWSSTLADDVKKLKDVVASYAPKGVDFVSVCLDDDAKLAAQTIQSLGLPGLPLHAKGGLDSSPLATGYGIMVVPHIFVVGKDGKIVNRNAQITTVEDEVKRLVQP